MFKTSMLRSDLCGYSETYIFVKATIDLLAAAANENNKVEKDVAFENNNPFRSKVDCTLIDNAEDLEIFKRMYNLLEYSQNFSMTLGILWNYYGDKIDVYDNAPDGKSFAYKTKIVGSTPEKPINEGDKNRPSAPTLNYQYSTQILNNVWRSFDLPLINCKTELDLS